MLYRNQSAHPQIFVAAMLAVVLFGSLSPATAIRGRAILADKESRASQLKDKESRQQFLLDKESVFKPACDGVAVSGLAC